MQVACNKCGWTEGDLTRDQAFGLVRYNTCDQITIGCNGHLEVFDGEAKLQGPTWEVYCLECGKLAESQRGDDIYRQAISHKKANLGHIVLIASEILEEEVVQNGS